MTPRTLSYQTFAEIARETAKELHGELWPAYSDGILSSLLHAFWFGRFIDGNGQSCTFDLSHRQSGAYHPITREVVWRLLGDNRPRNLWDFREGSPPPWDIVATAKIEDYGSGTRAVFENLALSETDASTWVEQYKKLARPSADQQLEKRGRKPKYDWNEFFCALVEIADKDGLPEQQSKLEKIMLDWCTKNWGEDNEPSESNIRSRVANLYPRPYIEG